MADSEPVRATVARATAAVTSAAGPPRAKPLADPGLGFRGFVALMAALMGVNAIGIDSMLAALPAIGRSLHIATPNQRQFIVTMYVLGFGAAQVGWGPAADRVGRRPVLLAGLAAFTVMSLVAGFAATFPLMLAARFCQGVAAAASRILSAAVVRDCYAGRTMARVMSLSMMVFLTVPVLAPTLGELVLLATGNWRAIFHLLSAFGGILLIVSWARLRETLRPEFRRPAVPGALAATIRRALGERLLTGYALAQGLTFGAMLGFVNSVGQIFADVYGLPHLFTLAFAIAAGGMIAANFLNARIVERLGTRRVSHTALVAYVGVALFHLAVVAAGLDGPIAFTALIAAQMFCGGLCGPNFGAMALEPVGDIAGTASSVQGFISTITGALAGLAVSQSYDGTTLPLAVGFLLLGLGSLATVWITERGRLFTPRDPDPVAA